MVDAIVVAAVAVAALLRTLVLRPFRGARPPGLSLRAELVRDVIRALVLHSRRAGIRWLRAATGVTGPPAAILQQASFEGAIVGGVAGDVCVPLDEPEPARTIVYFHGGGYVIGSVASYHETLARLALGARARVLGVEYRLAPEHLLPAAQDDCLAATRGVLGEHDPASVVLAGDSAGGALVAATLCTLRDAGQPLPAAGVLICPWTDPLADGGSMQENATTDFATREVLVDWISKAVGPGGDARDPRFAPLHADLTGLPPLLVQVGGQELLLDQARAFAERAEKSGVATTLRVWERMFHVFQMQAGLLPEGAAAIDEICAFVQDRTGAGEIREPA